MSDDDYPGGWFGASWGAPVCDPDTHRPTPADEICANPECLRPIQPDDSGLVIPHVYAPGKWRLTYEHIGCFRRKLGIDYADEGGLVHREIWNGY